MPYYFPKALLNDIKLCRSACGIRWLIFACENSILSMNYNIDHRVAVEFINSVLRNYITLISHITRQAQYEHPCLVPCFNYQPEVRYFNPPRQTHYQPHSVLVPANPYLNEEIPDWLIVYFKASIDLDYKLNWDLFRLNELDCFNAMLTRLYKQELQNIVMRYESYRSALLVEMEKFKVHRNTSRTLSGQ